MPENQSTSEGEGSAKPTNNASGFRRLVFWLHLLVGLGAGFIVLVMAVTGAILAYERQIVAASDSAFRVAPPAAAATRMDVEALLAAVQAQTAHGVPVGLTLRSDPDAPAAVSFGQSTTFFVDPYTGAVLGEATRGWRPFFRWITNCHRWLGGNGRGAGKAITGACNLAFLFLVTSGVFLWFPRKWTQPAVAAVTRFNGRLKGRARDWNWHNVLGFWSALPLVVIVSTGVVMSYPWANALLFRATGSKPPAPTGKSEAKTEEGDRGGGKTSAEPEAGGNAGGLQSSKTEGQRSRPGPRRGFIPPVEIRTAGLNPVWAVAERKVAGWNYVSLRFPQKAGDPLTFLVDRGNGARPDLRATLTLDADTAAELDWEPYSSMDAGQKARNWVRWLHTGEAGGWIGQTIGLLACLAATVLVWTGFALSWRRFFGKKG